MGDGETDIPAMKTVSLNGGKAIAVYNPNTKTKSGRKSKKITQDLVSQGRANYVAPADYTEGSSLIRCLRS